MDPFFFLPLIVEALAYPRIVIEQALPRQSQGNTSPATLWLWGATHSITLDGTPDGRFLSRRVKMKIYTCTKY